MLGSLGHQVAGDDGQGRNDAECVHGLQQEGLATAEQTERRAERYRDAYDGKSQNHGRVRCPKRAYFRKVA